jgi:hypothetical protein
MGNSASDLIVQTIKRQFLDVIIYLLTAAKAYINITFLLAVTADCAFIYNYTFVALTRVIAHAMNDPQNFLFVSCEPCWHHARLSWARACAMNSREEIMSLYVTNANAKLRERQSINNGPSDRNTGRFSCNYAFVALFMCRKCDASLWCGW